MQFKLNIQLFKYTSIAIFKWIFCIIFLFAFIMALIEKSFLSAIAFSIAGLILLPPFSKVLQSKTPFLNNTLIKSIIIITLVAIAGANLSKTTEYTQESNIQGKQTNSDKKEKIKTMNKGDSIFYDEKGKQSVETDELKENIATNSISGIQPPDVYLNFEKIGYETDKKISAEGSFFYSTFSEKGIDYSVTTYSDKDINLVNAIDLQATRMIPQMNKVTDMKPFLKYGCSIPYDGADAGKINEFIDANYYKNKASIVISAVRFTIFVPTQFARLITITKE